MGLSLCQEEPLISDNRTGRTVQYGFQKLTSRNGKKGGKKIVELADPMGKTFKWRKLMKYLENSTEMVSGGGWGGGCSHGLVLVTTYHLTLKPSVTACRRKPDTNKNKRKEMKARSKEMYKRKKTTTQV